MPVTILAWVAIALGIFWLPYRFPQHSEAATVESLSLLTGFNNSVAIVALLAGVLLLTALRWRQKLPPQFRVPSTGMPVKPLLVVCSIQTLLTATLIVAVHERPPAAEAYYFLDRMYPLAAGMAPYRDFEFLYGPLLVYLPYWFSKLLGAALYPVYLCVFLAFELIGLYILWKIIGIARAPVRTKTLAFYCLAAITLLNLSLGLQYTLPRYLTAFCAVLALAAFARTNRSRPILLAPFSAILGGVVFGLSPEMGLVFIPATLAVLIAQAREAGDRPIVVCLPCSLGSACFSCYYLRGCWRESVPIPGAEAPFRSCLRRFSFCTWSRSSSPGRICCWRSGDRTLARSRSRQT
jgi:hypothetical protein